MEAKKVLRQQIKDQWNAVNDEQRATWAKKAFLALSQLPEFQSTTVIYAYAPDNFEIPFMQQLCKEHQEKTWCFPRIAEGQMSFYTANHEDLKPGYLDLLEPPTETVAPAPDLILVPAVAASPDGQRLGRGGGFYDRFLAEKNASTITILPEFAVLREIPCEEHDQSIDKILKMHY